MVLWHIEYFKLIECFKKMIQQEGHPDLPLTLLPELVRKSGKDFLTFP
jgi:hypothetical protein